MLLINEAAIFPNLVCPACPLTTWEPPSWSTQKHARVTSWRPVATPPPLTRAARHVAPTLIIRDQCWNTFHYHEKGHPQLWVYYFVVIVNTVQSFSIFFFFVVCLRIRLRHVSLHKYWHESLHLFSIFLWKTQYGNVPLSPFTLLFWLLAPGSSYCSNQCLLA